MHTHEVLLEKICESDIFITANDLLIHNRKFHGVCHSTGRLNPIFSSAL